MLPKRLIHPQLERRFSPAIKQDITWAKRLHIGSERVDCRRTKSLASRLQQPATGDAWPTSLPEVTVSKPEQKEVVNWNEFTGRTTAVKLVTVTPRVSGYIVDIPFKEGDIVHKGDLLFQIDPRPYQDAYDQAVGQLQQAQANQQLQDADVRAPTAFARDGSHREGRLRYGFVEQEPSRGAGGLGASGTQFGSTES